MFAALSSFAIFLAATVADVRSFTDADYLNKRPVTLSGLVSAAHNGVFILSDTTGSKSIHVADGTPLPSAGNIITANCFCTLEKDFVFLIYSTNNVVTGSTALPPPRHVSVADVQSGNCDYQRVSLTATVVDALNDVIDPLYSFLLLSDGTNTIVAANRERDAVGLVGAKVCITGLADPSIGGWRRFQGRGICPFDTQSDNYIRILTPPPLDPFDVPEYVDKPFVNSSDLLAAGRKSVTGVVKATWQGNHFLLVTYHPRQKYIRVILPRGGNLPTCGQTVKVVGLPRTDLVSITLEQAIWRAVPLAKPPTDDTEILNLTAKEMFTDATGRSQINALLHGKLIQLSGIVRSIQKSPDSQITLIQSDDHIIPADFSSCPSIQNELTEGCKVTVTGVCLLKSEAWRPDVPVPDIQGFFLVVRHETDVRILSRPSWWTPTKFFLVAGILLAMTLGVLIWNRILGHLVVRRSRELAREQIAHDAADLKIGERTRLAVELHDSLSQNFEGLACQITALEGVLTEDPLLAREFLATARQMLTSCRTELRSCLFDLRGNALQASTFTIALQRTLKPFSTATSISIQFDTRTSHFSDSTVHAVLCIVRELVANAIRHGKAEHVRIAGECRDRKLEFTVDDDGCGFDTSAIPGIESGHFGISGMRTRAERMGGSFEISSSPGAGTHARVTIQG